MNYLKEDELIYEGDQIQIKQKKMEPFTFQDLFKQVQINIPDKATRSFYFIKE